MDCPQTAWPDDRDYFREFFRKAEAARVPLVGSLELTRRCNLGCIHCYLGDQEQYRLGQARELTTAQVVRILDEIVAAGCLELLITGGDPLLRPDFPDIYRHAKLAGLAVTVFTNGTTVGERHVKLFVDLPPREVEITLYGATAATYERITGVTGSYDRCLTGIQRLLDNGIRVGLKTVLMTLNSHELPAMEAVARAYGAPFRFDPAITPCLDAGRAPLRLRVGAEEVVSLEFAGLERRRMFVKLLDTSAQLPPLDAIYQCGAAQTGFHIDAYGNLQPCMVVTDLSYNLITGSFAEGWGTIGRLRERRTSAGSICASCELRLYCGYCPGLFALENGSEEVPSAYLCALGEQRRRATMFYNQGGDT